MRFVDFYHSLVSDLLGFMGITLLWLSQREFYMYLGFFLTAFSIWDKVLSINERNGFDGIKSIIKNLIAKLKWKKKP